MFTNKAVLPHPPPKSKDRVSGRISNGTPRVKEPTKLVKAKKESSLKEMKETPIKEIKETPIKEIIKEAPIAESNGTPMKETDEALVKVTNVASVKEIKEIPVLEMKESSDTMTEQVSEETAAQS